MAFRIACNKVTPYPVVKAKGHEYHQVYNIWFQVNGVKNILNAF